MNLFKIATHCLIFSVVLSSLGLGMPTAHADDVYTFVIKKQDEKDKYRWNLADWLVTRDRMRLQDIWLALHSSSPYEYFIGANYQLNQYVTGSSFNTWDVSLGAFSSIIGLEGHVDSTGPVTRIHGLFNLRIAGYHDQSTNLTLQVGILHTNGGTYNFRNAVAGASLTFYLTRVFGFEGLYRYYFPSTENASGVSYSGGLIRGGGFVDFRFVRVYGDYFTDLASVPASNGVIIGTKVYF